MSTSDSGIGGTDTNKFSAVFREMAERIERNTEADFAGAMLIVPPQGDPIAVMLADPTQDKEAFLALCAGKLQVATQEYAVSKPQGGNWGQRQR